MFEISESGSLLVDLVLNVHDHQLRIKFILLINVKMPTTVGILTFISWTNYRLWWSKSEISLYFGPFSIYEMEKNFMLSLVQHENIFITLGPGHSQRERKNVHKKILWPNLHDIRKKCPCNVYPIKPHFYSKTRVCKGKQFFLIFDPKHRLWVQVRTASARQLAVLTCIHNQCFEQGYEKF